MLDKLSEVDCQGGPLLILAIHPPLVYSKDPKEEILQILSGLAEHIEEQPADKTAYDSILYDAEGTLFGMIWYDAGESDDTEAG